MSLKSINFQKIKNLFWHYPKNFFVSLQHHFPAKKLKLIGITGTDGKTTSCILVYEILKKAGINAGVITTIGAKFGNNQEISTGLHMTSPDPKLFQQILSQMLAVGVTHVVCEVTAHGLDQYRFLGCHFITAAITNTSHEHLDYYSNMEEYIQSKAKIFSQSDYGIINKDDPSYQIIKPLIQIPYSTYSVDQKSDYQAKDIKLTNKKLSFKVNDLTITTDSNYFYQINNILVALGIIDNLKINRQFLLETVKNFPETKGRREEVKNDFKFKTIVDFAHTPNALEKTLSSLKKITKGKIIIIFGATGGRDQTKRPQMGQVVSNLADIAIITSDDTRNEDINQINQQIINGINPNKSNFVDIQKIENQKQINDILKKIDQKFTYFNIPNRQDAFNLAIKLAQPDDVVIACGKGHEDTILHGNTEYPWSETEAFRTALKLRKI